jgi:hypothetical protein
VFSVVLSVGCVQSPVSNPSSAIPVSPPSTDPAPTTTSQPATTSTTTAALAEGSWWRLIGWTDWVNIDHPPPLLYSEPSTYNPEVHGPFAQERLLPVDFDTEVVAGLTIYWELDCRQPILNDVVFDDTDGVVYGVFSNATEPAEEPPCEPDTTTFWIALQRDSLPDRFLLQEESVPWDQPVEIVLDD